MVTLCLTYLQQLQACLQPYTLEIAEVPADEAIPGSFWGDSEAGLVQNRLLVRRDTPLHSAMHEACHYICMDSLRRQSLHTDAGGDYEEENAVCYLQIVLAEEITGLGKETMMCDMDEWGYSFRLGSASKWFYEDACDALKWLQKHHILDQQSQPTRKLRT